ncbi:hypothetical protein M8J77_016826 [Diaphorina citri]|nr:hypothetical protein M8J77_016826 [Diaphorina citri]
MASNEYYSNRIIKSSTSPIQKHPPDIHKTRQKLIETQNPSQSPRKIRTELKRNNAPHLSQVKKLNGIIRNTWAKEFHMGLINPSLPHWKNPLSKKVNRGRGRNRDMGRQWRVVRSSNGEAI